MIRILFLLFATVLLSGCKKDTPDFERIDFQIDGQKFEILSTTAIFTNYIREYKNYKDPGKASKKLIFNPVEQEILEDAEAAFMIQSIKIPYEISENLRSQIDALDTAEVVDIIKASLNSIVKLLPGPDTKIIILPTSQRTQETLDKYHMPAYGVTLGTGKIVIAINPTMPDWKTFLSYAVAHEYHHSTWISRNWINSDFSLIEYLVFEGRADAFALSVDTRFKLPATKFLTPEEASRVWNKIEPELDLKGTDRLIKIMYGDNEIPYGSGYTLGYGIVDAFKQKYPEYTDLQIIDMKPEKIFELSAYHP